NGRFWASTPSSYTLSRYLFFDSANVYPKHVSNKPDGLALRCVAQKSLHCNNNFRRFFSNNLLLRYLHLPNLPRNY
ncbi:hypothetical protein IKF63_01545, partial [Candidatus Saccharibacteria bacterium]|nr:hypothetical protein [Candidatus Saccharibacteria bacterium]